jgi:putative thiamine transport system permease protein
MSWFPVTLLLAIGALPVGFGLAGTLLQGIDASGWQELLATPGLANATMLSVWTGIVSTGGALCLAHAAVAVAWTPDRAHRLRLVSLPVLATPHLAIAIGMVLLLSPSGLILRMLSPWATGFQQPPDWATVQDPFGLALILGLIVKETPFFILVLLGALSQVKAERLMTQSRVLGYGPLKAWFVSVAPLLHRQSRLAIAAVLVFGLTNVEMAMALGPTTPPTLSLLLWQWFTDPDLAVRPKAFAGACLLLAIVAIVAGLLSGGLKTAAVGWRRWAVSGNRAAADQPAVRFAKLLSVSVLSLGIAALLSMLVRSVGGAWRFPQLVPAEVSMETWLSVFQDSRGTVWASLGLGFVAAAIAVALVLAAAEVLHERPAARQRIAMLLFVPLVLPQMAFLFGLQTLLLRLHLDGSWLAVLWSHLVFVLPYAWVVIAEARAHLHPGYRIIARTLGYGPVPTWIRVLLPLLARSILVALALGFAVSMALYLPTLFAGGGRIVTLTTEAAVAISTGDLRSAATYGALQALAPLTVFAVCALFSRALFRQRQGMPG